MSGIQGLSSSDSLSLDSFSLKDAGPAEVFFEAKWTSQNIHLREKMPWDYSLGDIIQALFTDPFFFPRLMLKGLLNPLVGRIVIMSRNFESSEIRYANNCWNATWTDRTNDQNDLRLREHYEPIPIRVMTPDHAMITGTFYRALRAQRGKDIPTIITAQPNACLYKINGVQNWLLRRGSESRETFNVVAWDYRGTGGSGGNACSSNQIVLDGESIHQCVGDKFGISENNIRWYGRSIGGAPATQIRAIHQNYNTPDGATHQSHAPCVNMLSLNSLIDLVDYSDYLPNIVHDALRIVRRIGLPDCIFGIIQCVINVDFIRALARWLLSMTDFEFTVPAAIQTINREDLLVVCDIEDEIIGNASAQRSAAPEQVFLVTSERYHHHNVEEEILDGNGSPAADRIFKHLLR